MSISPSNMPDVNFNLNITSSCNDCCEQDKCSCCCMSKAKTPKQQDQAVQAVAVGSGLQDEAKQQEPVVQQKKLKNKKCVIL